MGIFTNSRDDIELPPAYTVFGTPAKSMGNSSFAKSVGRSRVSAGAAGEGIIFDALRQPGGWLPADVPLFCSMRTPHMNGSDIDFAVAQGNRILLIDAKMYKNGGFYWNYGDHTMMMRNLSAYKYKSGDKAKLSRSMIAAQDILSREMPNYEVQSIVVFATDFSKRDPKVPFTRFMTYPDNIPVLNMNTAPKYISRYFAKAKRTVETENAERYLKSLVQ